MKVKFLVLMLSLVALSVWSGSARSAEKQSREEGEHVQLFSAMKNGQVEVKLTTRDSMDATVAVKNKTDKPLIIDMPAAFAGVHVVGQFDMPGFGGGGPGGGMGGMANGGMGMGGRGGNGGGGGGNQSVGGGMGGGGGMSGGMGGGWFVAPEKTVRQKVRTVCLEHGKKEPSAFNRYQIVPIDNYTKNKTTQVLCEMLGNKNVDQKAVQAAVWNQENKMSFEELANKKVRLFDTSARVNFFSKEQVLGGAQLLKVAQTEVGRRESAEQKAKEEAVEQNESSQTKESSSTVDRSIENMTEKLLNK